MNIPNINTVRNEDLYDLAAHMKERYHQLLRHPTAPMPVHLLQEIQSISQAYRLVIIRDRMARQGFRDVVDGNVLSVPS